MKARIEIEIELTPAAAGSVRDFAAVARVPVEKVIESLIRSEVILPVESGLAERGVTIGEVRATLSPVAVTP
jgi:hypothetical protein